MPSHYDGPEDERRALTLFIAITRSSDRYQKRALDHAPLPEGLTLSQFAVMEALYHLGSMYQNTVAGKVLKTKGNITLVVDNLEKAGHVKRRADETDRRRTVLDLTPEGRALMTEYFPRIARGFTEAASVLSPEEQTTLIRLARKLGGTGLTE